MKIAYLTLDNASNVNAWSGLTYNILNALKKADEKNEFVVIDNLYPINIFTRIVRKIIYLTLRLEIERTFIFAKFFTWMVKRKLPKDTDAVFSIAPLPIVFLRTNAIKCFFADAVFVEMVKYYGFFKSLSRSAKNKGIEIEKLSIDNCDLVFFPSDWAREGAIKNYNTDPKKLKVVPFGANIQVSRTKSHIENVISQKNKNICNLLFIGVDWERKGGG